MLLSKQDSTIEGKTKGEKKMGKEKKTKRIYQKWWFWTILVIAILMFSSIGQTNDVQTKEANLKEATQTKQIDEEKEKQIAEEKIKQEEQKKAEEEKAKQEEIKKAEEEKAKQEELQKQEEEKQRVAAEEAKRKEEEQKQQEAQKRASQNSGKTSTSTTKQSSSSTTTSTKQKTTTANNNNQSNSQVVYITKTGGKYHRSGCQYLKKSCIQTTLGAAKSSGYGACSKCKP